MHTHAQKALVNTESAGVEIIMCCNKTFCFTRLIIRYETLNLSNCIIEAMKIFKFKNSFSTIGQNHQYYMNSGCILYWADKSCILLCLSEGVPTIFLPPYIRANFLHYTVHSRAFSLWNSQHAFASVIYEHQSKGLSTLKFMNILIYRASKNELTSCTK